MILLLLTYSSNLFANSNNVPLRGKNYLDSINITIPVDYIKKANAKLIERRYILKINKEQDSIIILKNKYINKQKLIIDTLENKINYYKYENNILNENVIKQNSNIIKVGTSSLIIGIIIGLILN